MMKFDLGAERNKRVFLLNLLRCCLARGNAIPVLHPFLAVKAINLRKSHLLHASKIMKCQVRVKRSRFISDSYPDQLSCYALHLGKAPNLKLYRLMPSSTLMHR
jgi:hypothetical protein